MPYTKEEHQDVAARMQRDEQGHFMRTDPTHPQFQHPLPSSPFPTPIQVSRTSDDNTLVNVQVNNPLRRITKLLEDIKRQKAFSFSIKGSLGIAGVALVLTTFGLFGGTRAFCSKGVQSHFGTVHVLQISNSSNSSVPFVDMIRNLLWNDRPDPAKRVALIKPDNHILQLKNISPNDSDKLHSLSVLVTGDFDSCSQTVTVNDQKAIEQYP